MPLCVLLFPAPVVRAQGVGVGVTGGINLSEINASGNELLNVVLTDKIQPVADIGDSPDLGGAVPVPAGSDVKFRNRGFVFMAAIRF